MNSQRDSGKGKRRRRSPRHSLAFQRALFHSISDGILVLDDQGRVADCNLAAAASVGRVAEVLIGSPGSMLCAQAASWELWTQILAPQLLADQQPSAFDILLRRRSGEAFTAQVRASRLAGPDDGTTWFTWVFRDITDELRRNEQLERQATHDSLTGLPNRLLFRDRLERAREHGLRHRISFALMMMDLDGFKQVNDTHGHESGDALLATMGARLRAALRAADTVSRMGGDEFAVLLPGPISARNATRVAAKLLELVELPVELPGLELHVSASIGVALFPQHDGGPQGLLSQADRAMYAAKEAGKGRVELAKARASRS